MSQATRERKLKGWARAVKGVLASGEEGRPEQIEFDCRNCIYYHKWCGENRTVN
jgi:hypothetical protein